MNSYAINLAYTNLVIADHLLIKARQEGYSPQSAVALPDDRSLVARREENRNLAEAEYRRVCRFKES